MTSPPPISENLTLFETSRLLLSELQTTNRLLVQQMQGQTAVHELLREVGYLLNGFTSGGASFSAYQSDTMTQAYLAVMGPLLAAKLASQDLELPEMMKGATLLARQLIDELSAYRSERGGLDYLEEQAELIHDPWEKASEEQDPA